ncbi:serine/threonine-protein kinase [Amycolatopsis pittospori]|uniref:serine/threonine-protein kinase n=1 Tax=Amycolatopsis pittospori TaxID=2749434 RepID=UPI0015F05136|nr:serine/threonine-protein kinase [Amycolatopsis pittospori]
MAPQVGEEFGGFRIDGIIGRGGMGVVYRAWQHRMRRPVALKVLPPQYAEDPVYRERFGREAAALARLDSPHVVAVFDHGEVDGCLYLAMQLVDGPDLSKVLETGPMDPGRALAVVDQVVSALGDAHAIGVVHRDVKAANVLLRPRAEHHDEDFVYLCDFGIARSAEIDRTSETSGVIGTVGYMAPERLHGESATAASDVYAVGCLLWVVLTGELPYRGSQPEVIVAHDRAPIPQLVVGDPRTGAVNVLLKSLLAKDPRNRPTVREVRDRIREIRADVPGSAVAAVPAGPPRHRRPGLVAGVLGAIALVIAIAVAAVFLLNPGVPAADRVTRSTPAGLACAPVAVADEGVRAQVVCRTGGETGELRIAALDDVEAATAYLRTGAGTDPAGLTVGKCPGDLPAKQSWSRDGHRGTLVCAVLGTTTRYAWTDEEHATVSVLDGRVGTPYPADLRAVEDFFAALRFA